MSRLDAVNYISHGIAKAPGPRPRRAASRAPKAEARGEKRPEDAASEALDAYCVNLNKKAEGGKIDPLIGREAEVERTIQILCRRTEEQPALCRRARRRQDRHRREAWRAASCSGDVPEVLQNATIFALDMGALLAGHPLSRRFRGAAEGRWSASSRSSPSAILFIDEIHTVIGAGATSGGAMDASNLLKPALAGGVIRCIGSTTYKEYRNYFEKDRALVRRFQKIDVNEPTIEDSIKILRGLKPYYEQHHKVRYTADAIKRGGRAVAALHQRPQAAGQGDRRDRRDRRGADAACPRADGARRSPP